MVAGDRVGLHLRNHAEHVEVMLGVFKLRAVPVNVNFRYTAEELAHLVSDSAMVALVTEPDLAPVAREAARLAGRPDLVIVERGPDYDALLAGAAADPARRGASAPATTSTCSTPAAPRARPRA